MLWNRESQFLILMILTRFSGAAADERRAGKGSLPPSLPHRVRSLHSQHCIRFWALLQTAQHFPGKDNPRPFFVPQVNKTHDPPSGMRCNNIPFSVIILCVKIKIGSSVLGRQPAAIPSGPSEYSAVRFKVNVTFFQVRTILTFYLPDGLPVN